MPHKVFTEEDEVMTCKLHTNSIKKNHDETPTEDNSSPHQESREAGNNSFSHFKRPPPTYTSSMQSHPQVGSRPPEDLSLPPKKLSRSTGERRKEGPTQPTKRERAESAASPSSGAKDDSPNSRSRQDDHNNRDCSSDDEDERSPLSNSTYQQMNMNQIVNESVI